MSEIETKIFEIFKEKSLKKLDNQIQLTEEDKNLIRTKIENYYNSSNHTEMMIPWEFMPTSSWFNTILDRAIDSTNSSDVKTIVFENMIHCFYVKDKKILHLIFNENGLVEEKKIFAPQRLDSGYTFESMKFLDIMIYQNKLRLFRMIKIKKVDDYDKKKYWIEYLDFDGNSWHNSQVIEKYLSPVIEPQFLAFVKEPKLYLFFNLRPIDLYTLRYRTIEGDIWTGEIDLAPNTFGKYIVLEQVINEEKKFYAFWETQAEGIKWKSIESTQEEVIGDSANWKLLLNSIISISQNEACFSIIDQNDGKYYTKIINLDTKEITESLVLNLEEFFTFKIIDGELTVFGTKTGSQDILYKMKFNHEDKVWIDVNIDTDNANLELSVVSDKLWFEKFHSGMMILYESASNNFSFIDNIRKRISSVAYMLLYILDSDVNFPFLELHCPFISGVKVFYQPQKESSISLELYSSYGEIVDTNTITLNYGVEFDYQCKALAFPIKLSIAIWGIYDLIQPEFVTKNWDDMSKWVNFDQSEYFPRIDKLSDFYLEKKNIVTLKNLFYSADEICFKTKEEIKTDSTYTDFQSFDLTEEGDTLTISCDINLEPTSTLSHFFDFNLNSGKAVGNKEIDLITHYKERIVSIDYKYTTSQSIKIKYALLGPTIYYHYKKEGMPFIYWGRERILPTKTFPPPPSQEIPTDGPKE